MLVIDLLNQTYEIDTAVYIVLILLAFVDYSQDVLFEILMNDFDFLGKLFVILENNLQIYMYICIYLFSKYFS